MYSEISPYKVFEYYLVHPCCSSLDQCIDQRAY